MIKNNKKVFNDKEASNHRNKILEVINQELQYFLDNPKHLAWGMMHYSMMNRAFRQQGLCNDNLKYPVEEMIEKMPKEQGNLIYDAWGITQGGSQFYQDPALGHPLESKKDKTLDEWTELLTSPDYKHHSLYTDAWRVHDSLLCTIGTEHEWTDSGFIAETVSGTDLAIFSGYTLAENDIRKDIRKKIEKISSHSQIKETIKKALSEQKIYANSSNPEREALEKWWRVKEAMNNAKLPVKEYNKVREGFLKTLFLEEVISRGCKWNEEQWSEVHKNNIIMIQNKPFDVSSINLESRWMHLDFEHESFYKNKRNNSGRNNTKKTERDYSKTSDFGLRDHYWINFVYSMDESDTEIIKAREILKGETKEMFRSIIEKDKMHISKSDKEKYDAAHATIRSKQPNIKEYEPIYKRARKGDMEAQLLLDEKSGVPAAGWDSVYAITQFYKNLGKREQDNSEIEKKRKHYPLSNYSNLVNMPANAHPSYLKAGIVIANEILENPEEPQSAKKYAQQFLKQHTE